MKADIKAGLIDNVERVAIGGVIADMLGLAREALNAEGDGAKNFAAVPTAASRTPSERWGSCWRTSRIDQNSRALLDL